MLYNVEPSVYQAGELDSQNIILSLVSGDRHRCTVFALGIMPYITSSLVMWILLSARGSEFKSRVSPQKLERYTLALMLPIAAMSAVSCAGDLLFRESRLSVGTLRGIAAGEMVAGALVIYRLANLNRERGLGGHAPILLVNIADNLITTLRSFPWEQLRTPLVLCVVMAGVILLMEHVIIRIPVQRVSIHNMYADKSCIALKLDPIGVMPVMFATSFFMIPQLLVRLFLFIGGENPTLLWISEELSLTRVTGTAVYLATVFALNIVFSFLSISPGETAEQLQKNGDSIVNVYAGKKTRRYLRRLLLLLALVSGGVLCLMMGVSLGLSLAGEIAPELTLFPATAMILVGILCPLYREVRAYWKFDSYSFFI